jgi:uncharacterized protein (TIGR02118 family)
VIKTLSLIKRRSDLDRAAFRNHYETSHAPLALPLMKGLVRYVRYHLEEDLLGDVGFDVLSAFWYKDAQAVSNVMETMQGEAGKPILADEQKFMDKPANIFFPVSERLLNRGEEGDEHVFVLVRKPADLSRYDGAAQLANEHIPKLLEGFLDADFALLRDAFPMRSGDPAEAEAEEAALRYNAVLQVRASSYAGLGDWAAALGAEGYGVTAVRTRRFETEIP